MKHLIFLILMSILMSCSSDEQSEEIIKYDGPIAGKWKLVETFISSDGAEWPQWYEIETEDSYTYTFKTNGDFLKSVPGDCSSGIYIVDSDYLILDYDCDATIGDNPPGVFKEEYEFSQGLLILIPNYLNCDEGCGWKYEKIEDF